MDKEYGVVVVDAMNLAHRGRWRARGSLTREGCENGLERGLVEGLLSIRQQHLGATIVLAWDGEPVHQRAAYHGYKAGRASGHADLSADWHARCDGLREALTHVYPTLHDPWDEADV